MIFVKFVYAEGFFTFLGHYRQQKYVVKFILTVLATFAHAFNFFGWLAKLWMLDAFVSSPWHLFSHSSAMSLLCVFACLWLFVFVLSYLFSEISAMSMVRTWETGLKVPITHAPHAAWMWFQFKMCSEFVFTKQKISGRNISLTAVTGNDKVEEFDFSETITDPINQQCQFQRSRK